MGGTRIWMALLAIGMALMFLAGCAQSGAPPYTPPGGSSPYPAGGGGVPTSSSGRAVFAATDKAASMGAVSSVQITIDQARVHSSGNDWVSLNMTPKTIDLLQLNATGYSALLADVNLTAGTYDQVWLQISNVMVTDANGTHAAKLPSGTLRFMLNSAVAANQTASVVFDFDAAHSLHLTGNGQYILAPVVQAETRDDAQVDDRDEANVRVMGGRVREHKTVGMDASGNVGVGLRIADDANLSIGAGDLIRVNAPGMEERTEGGANGAENGQASSDASIHESDNGSVDVGARMRLGAW